MRLPRPVRLLVRRVPAGRRGARRGGLGGRPGHGRPSGRQEDSRHPQLVRLRGAHGRGRAFLPARRPSEGRRRGHVRHSGPVPHSGRPTEHRGRRQPALRRPPAEVQGERQDSVGGEDAPGPRRRHRRNRRRVRHPGRRKTPRRKDRARRGPQADDVGRSGVNRFGRPRVHGGRRLLERVVSGLRGADALSGGEVPTWRPIRLATSWC